MLISDNIKEDNRDNINGFVLVGSNNSGKTYQIIEIFKQMTRTINNREYNVENAIFLSQNMNVSGIEKSESQYKSSSNFNDFPSKNIDFIGDKINEESISKVIYSTILNKDKYYKKLIFELLSIELYYEKETSELLIFTDEEEVEYEKGRLENSLDYYYLKSSGYVSLIRMIVILDNLLNKNINWLLIDEPDAFLDIENRKRFTNIIEELKKRKNSNAKVIFSSHNSETLYSLPENYIIYKLIRKKVVEKYYSQDFFSKAKLEEQLFNLSGGEIYKSEKMKGLLTIYKNKLENKLFNYNLSNFNYYELSMKEKIIYNAINRLEENRI